MNCHYCSVLSIKMFGMFHWRIAAIHRSNLSVLAETDTYQEQELFTAVAVVVGAGVIVGAVGAA